MRRITLTSAFPDYQKIWELDRLELEEESWLSNRETSHWKSKEEEEMLSLKEDLHLELDNLVKTIYLFFYLIFFFNI